MEGDFLMTTQQTSRQKPIWNESQSKSQLTTDLTSPTAFQKSLKFDPLDAAADSPLENLHLQLSNTLPPQKEAVSRQNGCSKTVRTPVVLEATNTVSSLHLSAKP